MQELNRMKSCVSPHIVSFIGTLEWEYFTLARMAPAHPPIRASRVSWVSQKQRAASAYPGSPSSPGSRDLPPEQESVMCNATPAQASQRCFRRYRALIRLVHNEKKMKSVQIKE